MESSECLQQRIARTVRETVTIVPYDPEWPGMFELESEFLRNRLPRAIVLRIEHFGSTAVPGLLAKPIIDILIAVSSLAETKRKIVPMLESEGYEYFWRTDVAPPYAWFIKRDEAGRRTHHLHFVEADSKLWNGLYFRDYLRTDTEIAAEYSRLKMTLASEFPNDRIAYTKGKTEFIMMVTEKALVFYNEIE